MNLALDFNKKIVSYSYAFDYARFVLVCTAFYFVCIQR